MVKRRGKKRRNYSQESWLSFIVIFLVSFFLLAFVLLVILSAFPEKDRVQSLFKNLGELGIPGLRPLEISGRQIDESGVSVQADQPTQLQAFHRNGQTFITWNEIGNYFIEDLNFTLYASIVSANSAIKYRIYRYTSPITASNIDQAVRIAEVGIGKGYNYYIYGKAGVDGGGSRQSWDVPRFVIQEGAGGWGNNELPLNTGLHVYTIPQGGNGNYYYAITSVDSSGENKNDFSSDNSLQTPIADAYDTNWKPIRQNNEGDLFRYFTPNKSQYIFTRWEAEPLNNYNSWPQNYMVTIPINVLPPYKVSMDLHCWGAYWAGCISWDYYSDGILFTSTDYPPQSWWTGWNDNKSYWLPGGDNCVARRCSGINKYYTERRMLSFLAWIKTQWQIDENRIICSGQSMGGSGGKIFCMKHPEMFSYVNSWVGVGIPTQSDFNDSYQSLFGSMYEVRIDEEGMNTWDNLNMSYWLRANPKKETPFISFANGKNDPGIGWAQSVEYYKALRDTKRPFIFNWGQQAHSERAYDISPNGASSNEGSNRLDFQRDKALPAFTSFSLDNNPGNGDPADGDSVGGINLYQRWDPNTIIDQPGHFEIELWMARAPSVSATTDVTLRNLQALNHPAGQPFTWQLKEGAAVVQSGGGVADSWGLITMTQVSILNNTKRKIIIDLGAGEGTWPQGSLLALSVQDFANVSRNGSPVRSGIPFPQGVLFDENKARLLEYRNGVYRELPLGAKVIGRWNDNSIRWLLVDFLANVSKQEKKSYYLDYGLAVTKMATPSTSITQDSGKLTIDTGAGRFIVNKTHFTLFESVVVQGKEYVSGKGGVSVVGDRSFSTNVFFNATNPTPPKDASFPLAVRTNNDTQTQDWTLAVTGVSPMTFSLTGSIAGFDGTGTINSDFISNSGQISILRSWYDWIQYKSSAVGDKFHFSTYARGENLTEAEITNISVEEQGMHAVIKISGKLTHPLTSYGALDFTARMHFYAGKPDAMLEFRVENNHYSRRGSTDNTNGQLSSDIEQSTTYFFDDLTLYLPTSLSGQISFAGESGEASVSGTEGKLYQDSSGGASWNAKTANPPRHSSYVQFKGYEVSDSSSIVASGNRSLGGMFLTDVNGGVGVAVRDFWQNFPKALRAKNGRVEVGLFPGEYGGMHPFRTGEYKRHQVMFNFGGRNALESAASFQEPLMAFPSALWIQNSRALGYFVLQNESTHSVYEKKNNATVDVSQSTITDPSYAGRSLFTQLERYDLYGWNDFGDVPIDFECAHGEWNLKYDYNYGMFLQFVRSFDKRWWDLAMRAAKHKMDIDLLHQPTLPGTHFSIGGAYDHSTHDECGYPNPNRNYNGITTDLSSGIWGAITGYYFTGDEFLREGAIEFGRNVLHQYNVFNLGIKQNYTSWGGRSQFQAMTRIAPTYILTKDQIFKDVGYAFLNSSLNYDGTPENPTSSAAWNSGFVLNLARFVEENGNDPWAVERLKNLTDLLIERTYDPATGCLLDAPVGYQDFYGLLGADALAYSYLITGNKTYLDLAKTVYACGERNIDWKYAENGQIGYVTQQYSQAAATWGQVFMYAEKYAGGSCIDSDGDGYNQSAVGCGQADCNDTSPAIKPGIAEITCNGIDNNCNGNADEGLNTFYGDSDGDSYGSVSTVICSVMPPAGNVSRGGDCNDNNATINPGASEICNDGVDNNCASGIDEGCGSSCIINDPALQLHMNFDDGTSSDLSGKENNGVVSGATAIANGKYGGAFNFDGVNDYITINDGDNLDFETLTEDFSVFAWVRTTSPTQGAVIMQKMDALGDGWRFIFLSSGVVRGYINGVSAESSISVNDGQWHHVGFTAKRDRNLQVYIDGVASGVGVSIAGQIMNISLQTSRIGAASYFVETLFSGDIDDVTIFNKTLTNTEVLSLFNGSSCQNELCILTNAYWNKTNAIQDENVNLIVEGTNCDGKNINFVVYEDDNILDGDAKINPVSAVFSGGTATGTWRAEWECDGEDPVLGICWGGNPEYYFAASLQEDSINKISSEGRANGILQTTAAIATCGNFIPETGEECDDGNNVDLDGCSATCKNEVTPVCDGSNPEYPKCLPLLYSQDLTYEGAFKVPSGCGGGGQATFGYGGNALAYRADRNTLFMVGHVYDHNVAEISIPQIIKSTDLNALQTATLLQSCTDATEGHKKELISSGDDPGSIVAGGNLVFENNLYGTFYIYYDAGGLQDKSHFRSGLDLSVLGDFQGMYTIGNTPQAGFVSGYMEHIPAEWQSLFGGPALTGNCCLSIIGRTSLGPSAFVFNPNDLGVQNPVPSTPLVYYSLSHPTLGTWGGPDANPVYSASTGIRGVVFPEGTRSVLFFGRHGAGPYCYGAGYSRPQHQNTMTAVNFTMPNEQGTTKSMSVYVKYVDTAPNNQFSLAIYTDNDGVPGALLASSPQTTLQAKSWNTASLPAVSLSPNTTFWLTYNTNGDGKTQSNMKIYANTTQRMVWRNQTFGSWPNSFGTTEGSVAFSAYLYLNYTNTTGSEKIFGDQNNIGDESKSYCYDAVSSDKGQHNYPYIYQIWAYDALNLLDVKNGIKQPWEITPYSYWNFDLPFTANGRAHNIGGAVYDSANKRILFSETCTITGCLPVVHSFQVNTTAQPAVCGNNITEIGEGCDDGNAVGGDGCSALCVNEGRDQPPASGGEPSGGPGGGPSGGPSGPGTPGRNASQNQTVQDERFVPVENKSEEEEEIEAGEGEEERPQIGERVKKNLTSIILALITLVAAVGIIFWFAWQHQKHEIEKIAEEFREQFSS